MTDTIEATADSLSLLALDLRNGSLTSHEAANAVEEHAAALAEICAQSEAPAQP